MIQTLKKSISAFKQIISKTNSKNNSKSISIPDIDFASALGDGAWLLYGLVHAQKPTVCVEIGSARGLSACYIGLALKQAGQGKLYAIDPHEKTEWNDHNSENTFSTIQTNLKEFAVEQYVEIIRGYSHHIGTSWTKPIDLLFIDGDHSYEGVKKDWDLFVPHLRPFGLIIFHDTIWSLKPDPQWSRNDMGVPEFVDELRKKGYPVITLPEHCGFSIVQSVKKGIKLTQ